MEAFIEINAHLYKYMHEIIGTIAKLKTGK